MLKLKKNTKFFGTKHEANQKSTISTKSLQITTT